MNRAMILTVLGGHRVELAQRFAAKRLAIFGSAARDDSDVDVLVSVEPE